MMPRFEKCSWMSTLPGAYENGKFDAHKSHNFQATAFVTLTISEVSLISYLFNTEPRHGLWDDGCPCFSHNHVSRNNDSSWREKVARILAGVSNTPSRSHMSYRIQTHQARFSTVGSIQNQTSAR